MKVHIRLLGTILCLFSVFQTFIIITVNIQENIQLQNLNTMATPSIAKWFMVAQTEDDIVAAMEFCQQQSCDYLVLGEGSNSLFLNDLDIFVIANRIGGAGQISDVFSSKAISTLAENDSTIDLRIGAGVNWHQLVKQSLEHEYYGLEQLALIPGLVGAAPIQNIGAYGSELQDVLINVRAFDVEKKQFIELTKQDCQFAYRDSLFKQKPKRYIITAVDLRLTKKIPTYSFDSVYAGLKPELAECQKCQTITPHDVFDAVCKTRTAKLPDPKIIPNAGSFFKNPVVSKEKEQALKIEFPNLVSYSVENGIKLAAGWLIEQTGFKGKSQENGVGCYEKQALVLINPEKTIGQSVYDFSEKVKQSVNTKFGVELEVEPRIY